MFGADDSWACQGQCVDSRKMVEADSRACTCVALLGFAKPVGDLSSLLVVLQGHQIRWYVLV